MRAVVMHEYGGPEVLKLEENVAEPEIGKDTVIVAAVAASVNPIDWKIRSGARQKDFPLEFPAILGRDVSGVVQAVGSEVRTFKAGDKVLAMANSTYAELVLVKESELTHLPDGLDLADAAAIPLVSLTGEQLVRIAANVQKDQLVLVTGALGSVGRAAVHAARKIGARVVAGVRKKNIEEAHSLGADGVLAIDDVDAIQNFGAFDAVADTVGGETAVRLLASVKDGGTFGYAAMLAAEAIAKYPKVKATRIFARPDPSKVREFADDLRDGKFVLPIGRRMPMRDAGEAQELGQKGGVGKLVLLMQDVRGA